MDPKIRDWQAKSVPLGRFSEPREQGEPCVLLFSDKASYITGAQLREYRFSVAWRIVRARGTVC